ncbi:MAG TPA: hypothetical protein VL948_06250 [Verrucomicrobiae bacterium]|jgi:hypothetical protein|nr:hypothetical protein [Verrucomicrobiae bacterium]
MPTAAQRVRAEGIASIALFMVLAAIIAPEPTPRGVGLRGVPRPGVGLRGVPRPGVARADVLPPVKVRPAQAAACRPLARGTASDPALPACGDAAGVALIEAR